MIAFSPFCLGSLGKSSLQNKATLLLDEIMGYHSIPNENEFSIIALSPHIPNEIRLAFEKKSNIA